MARYDYKCKDCKTIREVIHPMAEDPVVICTVCGGTMRRKPTAPKAIALNATDVLVSWMDENYRRYRARKQGFNAPPFSPDLVKRPEGIPGRDRKTR